MLINENDFTDDLDLENQIEGINLMQLFSLAKKCPIPRPKEEIVDLSECENQIKKLQKSEEKPSLPFTSDNETLKKLYDSAKSDIEKFYENKKNTMSPKS